MAHVPDVVKKSAAFLRGGENRLRLSILPKTKAPSLKVGGFSVKR